jgi:hypothetical protein
MARFASAFDHERIAPWRIRTSQGRVLDAGRGRVTSNRIRLYTPQLDI